MKGHGINPMIRVLIVDDHAIVRKGLMQILAECAETAAVDEADSGEEALEKVHDNAYDLVMLDISLPGKNGLEVLKEMKTLCPELPVLVLSMHPEEQYAIQALRTGASGYLTKACAADNLVGAIHKVLQGGKYISNSLAEKLAYGLINEAAIPLHGTLSNREYQVMRMIATGKRPKEISLELSLNVRTVSTYRGRIMHKMGMRNNAELAHYAIMNNILD